MYEMLRDENFRLYIWLKLGYLGPIIAGAVFIGQSHGNVGAILLCVIAIIAGVITWVATRFGTSWHAISTRRKLLALPGLIIGSVMAVVIVFASVAAVAVLKAVLRGNN